MSLILDSTKVDELKTQHARNLEIIRYLSSHGALLGSVKSEFLFSFEDYMTLSTSSNPVSVTHLFYPRKRHGIMNLPWLVAIQMIKNCFRLFPSRHGLQFYFKLLESVCFQMPYLSKILQLKTDQRLKCLWKNQFFLYIEVSKPISLSGHRIILQYP